MDLKESVMIVTVQGKEELKASLEDIESVLSGEFWIDVKKDYFNNLSHNLRKHRVTGRLQRNAYTKIIANGVEGGIINTGMMVSWKGQRINYAWFVENGTAEHTIKAKNKKSLRWVGGNGKFAFAKEVQHPGYKGSHFLRKAADKTFSNLQKILNKNLKGL